MRHRSTVSAVCLSVAILAAGCDSDRVDERRSVPASFPSEDGDYFRDVTATAGIDFVHSIGDSALSNLVESVGGGVAWLDYDGDGALDLYLTTGAHLAELSDGPAEGRSDNRLYRNRGDGTFEDVTRSAGVGNRSYGMGVSVGDYDNDGDPDVFLSNYGPNVLYRNNGDGTFTDVTRAAGVGGSGCSVGAVWADFDNDGFLDLYVGNYIDFDPDYRQFYAPDGFPGPLAYPGQPDVLYRNHGDGTFDDVTESTGVWRPDGRAMGVGAADVNDDGHIDLYVANDAMENYLFLNSGSGQFREVGLQSGVAYNHQGEATSSMAVDFADFDGDGHVDLFVSDMSYSALYHNEGNGSFRDVTYTAGIAVPSGQYVGWGTAFVDYDNDGDPDIIKINGDLQHLYGQEDQVFDNVGGAFVDVSTDRGNYFRRELVGRGAAFGDYDNDGDVDVFVVNLHDRGVLLRNDRGNERHWISLYLIGTESNRDGVGARVTVETGDVVQVRQRTGASGYLSQNDPRLHFGLGERTTVDRIEVRWPSGMVQVLENLEADRVLTITEPGVGS